MGKVLRVNLSTKRITTQKTSDELVRKYIGGYGTAGKVLYDEVPPWVEPLDPSNLLIFSTGPVTGTAVPTAGRHCIVTKSPLTGYFGDASSGGFWGAEFKFTGHDMMIINGRADRPVMITIFDDDVQIKDAASYWGMDARAADIAIRRDIGDKNVKVADIGQAGENLVRFAGIANDEADRIAARCGVGAVMGFKKLKAVAVRGTHKVPVADIERAKSIARNVTLFAKNDKSTQYFTKGGTPGGFELVWELGDVPAYNWSRTDFGGEGDPGVEKLAFPGGYEKILVGNRTCYVCAIACRRVALVVGGPYGTNGKVEGPEYETLGSFGPNCGIDRIEAVAKLNYLCNLYAIDTISAGSTLAFAMECFEKGLIGPDDTGGVELKFGNDLAAIEMIHQIAKREGFGNILAEGSRRAAQIIGRGAENYPVHVKGLEMSVHDPRAFQSGGVHYACTPTGARHTEGFTLFLELGKAKTDLPYPQVKDRFSTENKAELAIMNENWRAFINPCGWCIFADSYGYDGQKNHVALFSAVTGIETGMKEALLTGERIFNLKKSFNMKHGCTKEEDTLPERLLKDKNKAGAVVRLHEMLPRYYEARGWDAASGKPQAEKLKELGLEDVARELWPAAR